MILTDRIMKRITIYMLAAVLLLCAGVPSMAQSKKETKLYEKTLQTRTAAAYNKFLKKFPSSVYAPEISALRDTLLSISPISADEAFDVLTGLLPELKRDENRPQILKAIGYRDAGRDYVLGVCIASEVVPAGVVRVYGSECVKGVWQPVFTSDYERYKLNDMTDGRTFLLGDVTLVTVGSQRWLHAAYRNVPADGQVLEHVETLLEPLGNTAVSAVFYGKALDGQMRRIEGQSPEALVAPEMRSEEISFLLAQMAEDHSLVQIAQADALTDEAIAWWLENNPKAATSAKKLVFGQLPEECSIVEAFKKDRNKEKSGGYTAALFDIRGYTVVCEKNASGDYSLVWCEPKCKDRSRDKYLNTIYFEKGATLCLYYYKGRTTFKYRINLSSKNITR